jgi:hypothetical protein
MAMAPEKDKKQGAGTGLRLLINGITRAPRNEGRT